MCGIAGWVDFKINIKEQLPEVAQMTRTLINRGPDAEGIWHSDHVAFGHRRLAIIDLEGGKQPMEAEVMTSNSAVVTFCGEIYNYRELRDELKSLGHDFRTSSDTEVLLKAFLQWNVGAVNKLNGMFAFGIWDRYRQELILARDRVGVKPLYYFPTEHGIIFGSEPKAILANKHVPRRVTLDGLRELLDMVKTPGKTIYEGMYEVRPGEIIKFSRQGLFKTTYWKLEASPHTDSYDATVQTVRSLLEDTVRRQIISDVPICTLLSGGLDSSTVTAMVAKELGSTKVRSFSVDFSKNQGNFAADSVRGSPDAPFARALSEHVKSEHSEILLDSKELLDPSVRASVLKATDIPPAYWGDMWPSLYLLFREIRRYSTVALSGEAADEIFGGYQWFRNPAAVQADTFPWLTSGSSRYFGGTQLFAPDFLRQLDQQAYRQEAYQDALREVPVLPGESPENRRMREITYLNMTRFLQTLLDRKDRMSMAVGLEVRVPFCDHRLIEYVFNTPWQMKVADGREKSLLRAAVADLLPDSILNRVKTPYPATQDPRYENGLRQELREVIEDHNNPVLPLLNLNKTKTQLERAGQDTSQPYNRGSLEVVLWINRWLKEYNIELAI
ncbi:putative phenazine-modifying enzyme [Xenorhabdus stockiae]|uniref:asparagine synthase (glutamine-hydrolyzing) n=1 Tax=Xenorhabdus stockiae TaxID=351614 RepID=A0A2D0KT37_9GAMM|nr:asparagine synthase (glutamine-hydrolyzing) [Xenorhabdus stockiae]PHM66367.1 putative phenazine-modifying enzyme [Xenorhabdus stockiae]